MKTRAVPAGTLPDGMTEETMAALLRRTASTSVGPSTARRMGPGGTVDAAREFLAGLDPTCFRTRTRAEFTRLLNDTTKKFKGRLPAGAKNWGPARKFLNIFLRELVYNRHLCQYYDLYRLEPWLEVPLDGEVQDGLRREPGGDSLSPKRPVIEVDWRFNREYQGHAEKVARSKKIYRVHLDIHFYRSDFVSGPKQDRT